MTKTELIFQILLVATGGLIGSVSAIASDTFGRRAAYKREDLTFLRTRRDEFASHLLLLDAWVASQYARIINNGNWDDTENPIYKIKALAYLYFSDLIQDCEKLEKSVLLIQTTANSIYNDRILNKINPDLFANLMPMTNDLRAILNQILASLKTAPACGCTLRATSRK